MELLKCGEIVCEDDANARLIIDALVGEKYVTMISKEDDFIIINYINTCEFNEANRNGVVFMSRYDFDELINNVQNSELDI